MKKITQLVVLAGVLFAGTAATSCNNGKSSGTEAAAGKAEGDAVDLKFNVAQGEKYSYTSDINQKVTASGQQMQQNIMMKYDYEVAGADGANKKIKISYKQVKMEMTGPNLSMKYDSEHPEAGSKEMGVGFEQLLQKSITATVSPEGGIVAIEGIDQLLPKNAANAAGIDEKTMKQMLESSFNIYPGKPVKVGDSWTRKSNFNMQIFQMSIEATYTLKSVNGGKATLAVDSKISMDPSASTDPKMQNLKMQISGTQKGTLELEVASGQLVSGAIKQEIKGNINAGGKDMPMELSSDVRMTGQKL